MGATVQRRGVSTFRDPFLQHRSNQERQHAERVGDSDDPIHSLLTVEFNITELCNRKCVFCPRVDPAVYPNRNLNMNPEIAKKTARDLAEAGSKCRVSFSGFGEALLHKGFADILRAIRAELPENTLEVNTSGDRLTHEKLEELIEAGLTNIYINLYDGPDQIDKFMAFFEQSGLPKERWKLRPHWPGALEDHGLTLNNRSGMVLSPELGLLPLEKALERHCFYPFYKMLIDWNGDVLFCSNDWGREVKIGNVMERNAVDLWLSPEMAAVRLRLMNRDRSVAPCSACNVHGTLHGHSSYDRIRRQFVDEGLIDAESVPSSEEIAAADKQTAAE